MATIEQTAGGDFVLLPMGEYAGYVKSVTPGSSTFDGKVSPNLKFIFVLIETDDGEGSPVELWGWTSQIFSQHEKCKLMAWSKAIFDKKSISDDYILNTDDLLGRPVMVQVQKYTNGEGQEKNKVLGLSPHPDGKVVEVAATEESDLPF